jgi:hypothetical protein
MMTQLHSLVVLFLTMKGSCYGFQQHQQLQTSFSSALLKKRPIHETNSYIGSSPSSSCQLRIQDRGVLLSYVPSHSATPYSFRLFAIPALPLEGLFLGLAWVILPYFVRVASAERAWEERLMEARRKRAQETGIELSNVEFYQQSVSTYPSMYGPDGTLERKRKAALRKKEGKEGAMSEEEEEEEDLVASVQERMAFEKEFGLEYDPDYDDPLLEEELPKDLKFIKLSVYGDRMYEDGRVYFKDGDVYFRRGAKPRLRSFWE